MRIMVVSDSHGRTEDTILEIESICPDVIFHLGDFWRDGEELSFAFPDIPLYQVPGNCDWSVVGQPAEKSVTLGGVKFLLCHGHTYGVKNGYYSAVSHARAEGADVLLCGHTHRPHYEEFGSLQLFNPGSVGYDHTYGIITVHNGIAACSLRTMD